MSAVIIEHVEVADLPDSWQARLPVPRAARVTVRIEEETAPKATMETTEAIDLLFGMWRDCKDMQDVDAYVRDLRAPRYNRDGSRR